METQSMQDYERQKKLRKQPKCKHQYLIGKSNGKFQCPDCDIELDELPENKKLAF